MSIDPVDTARALMTILAEASVRALLAAALAALVLFVTRTRAAAVHHAVWTAIAAAMLAMPLLPHAVPPVTLAVAPLPSLEWWTALTGHPSGEPGADDATARDAATRPGGPAALSRPSPATSGAGRSAGADTRAVGAGMSKDASADANARLARLSWPSAWLIAAAVTYTTGLVASLVYVACGWIAMTAIVRRARRVALADADADAGAGAVMRADADDGSSLIGCDPAGSPRGTTRPRTSRGVAGAAGEASGPLARRARASAVERPPANGVSVDAAVVAAVAPVARAGGEAYESPFVASPLTAGVFAPRVILPSTWREWPDEMRAAVIAHERAHIRRRDPVVALLARVNRCVFWFHPLAWWLSSRLAATAEFACDDAAARACPPDTYARALVAIAEDVRRHGGRLAWQGWRSAATDDCTTASIASSATARRAR